MAQAPGRLATLSKNATVLAGLRNATISWNGDGMDYTDRDSNGIRTLGPELAAQSYTITAEGIASSPVFRDIAFTVGATKLLTDVTFKFADALTAADVVTGNMLLTNHEEANPHDAEATFSLTLESAGTWTLG
jgi:TP901-1 family phage major tail protein